jgi:hypothetical protein
MALTNVLRFYFPEQLMAGHFGQPRLLHRST